eukprot:COSAG04_NODE_3031_length_3254_cov_1.868188_3_plen_83_part_00
MTLLGVLTVGLAACCAGTSVEALKLEYMTDPVTGEMAPLPPADVPTLPDVREQTPLHLPLPLPRPRFRLPARQPGDPRPRPC